MQLLGKLPILKSSILALGLTLSLSLSASGVLALQNFDANSHSRFNDSAQFIGKQYDWSGVARASNGAWATLISPSYFISAYHKSPLIGNTVTFHENNDVNGPTVTRTVSSIERIPGTDLVIGRFSTPVSSNIATYALTQTKTTQSNFSSSIYANRTAYIVGLDNTRSGTTQFRLGQNNLEDFFDNASIPPSHTDSVIFYDDRDTSWSIGANEAFLQNGDSGAPVFLPFNGKLALTAINWFKSDENKFSGASFTPNYITQINNIVTAGGETLKFIAVPEPSSLMMLGLGLGFFIRYRSR